MSARDWRLDAACRSGAVDPEVPFADPGSAEVKAFVEGYCRRCPVIAACLRMALVAERGSADKSRYGVFGGLTSSERARLLRLGTRRCVTCARVFVPRNGQQQRCGGHSDQVPAPPSEHGSEAGYARHRRRDEEPCIPCREARRLADRERDRGHSLRGAA